MTTEREVPGGLAGLEQLFDDGDDWSRGGTPQQRRRRAHRRHVAWLVTLIVAVLILAAIGGYAAWALNAPVRPPVVTSQVPAVPVAKPAAVVLPPEGSSALAITGGDAYFDAAPTKATLTSGPAQPRPMASISKLITALVILSAHPLRSATDPGPTITFTAADHALYDTYYVMNASIAAMPTGSRLSLHDALAAMLLPSAANYAEALSTWAFGSQSAFLTATNRWLAAHGMHHTTMVEPTGMSWKNTSTPGDLLRLGRLAAANPALAAITAESSVTLPSTGTLYNTNDLLGTDGITGLKTGNLTAGTYNLLYTASLDVGLDHPLAVVGIMMGGRSHDSVNADVTNELASIRAGFHSVPLVKTGQDVGTYTTPWGSHARMVTQSDASITTWSNTPISVSMTTTTPKAYKDGATVGTITWKAGPQTQTTRLIVEGTITPPTAWWRLTHPFELGTRARAAQHPSPTR